MGSERGRPRAYDRDIENEEVEKPITPFVGEAKGASPDEPSTIVDVTGYGHPPASRL